MSTFIWTEHETPNQYVFARMVIERDLRSLRCRIVADSAYKLYVNGAFVASGPCPFIPPHVYVDELELTPFLKPGKNIILVHAHYIGILCGYYQPWKPGLSCVLDAVYADGHSETIAPDEGWQVARDTRFDSGTNRRNWTLGFQEIVDLSQPGADAAQWEEPVSFESDLVLRPRITPPLKFTEIAVVPLRMGVCGAPTEEMAAMKTLTQRLDAEPMCWRQDDIPDEFDTANGPVALLYDLGREQSGCYKVDFDCARKGGVVDVCFAERLQENGRPLCWWKGTEYTNRYLTAQGRNAAHSFWWFGMRYIYIVFRDCGKVALKGIRFTAQEAGPGEYAVFTSSDDTLNRIYELCLNTFHAADQHVQVDCPTREQALYWGDGLLNAEWYLRLTGSSAYLEHMMELLPQAIAEDGSLPACPFHIPRPLFDYSLLAVRGVARYSELTGDRATAARLYPAARCIVEHFERRLSPEGLLYIDHKKEMANDSGILFIDHPGLGWHNAVDDGIDRQGLSCGMNLLLALAYEALAKLCEEPLCVKWQTKRDHLLDLARCRFYDEERGLYFDAYNSEQPRKVFSQQTNTLAAMCGLLDENTFLETVLPGTEMNKATPYFYGYMFTLMRERGWAIEQLIELINDLWSPMLGDHFSGCLWETFMGDSLDSYCHPWSAAPIEAIQSTILGVTIAPNEPTCFHITPGVSLLKQASGTVYSSAGSVTVSWTPGDQPGSTHVTITPSEGCRIEFSAPKGFGYTVDQGTFVLFKD